MRSNAQWIKLHMEEDAYNDQINILYFFKTAYRSGKIKNGGPSVNAVERQI